MTATVDPSYTERCESRSEGPIAAWQRAQRHIDRARRAYDAGLYERAARDLDLARVVMLGQDDRAPRP